MSDDTREVGFADEDVLLELERWKILAIKNAEHAGALREQLREAETESKRLYQAEARWITRYRQQGDEIRRLTDTLRDVRRRVAPYPDGDGREVDESAFDEIRRIIDALREAKPALLRVVDELSTGPQYITQADADADAATLRALAEMGESDD